MSKLVLFAAFLAVCFVAHGKCGPVPEESSSDRSSEKGTTVTGDVTTATGGDDGTASTPVVQQTTTNVKASIDEDVKSSSSTTNSETTTDESDVKARKVRCSDRREGRRRDYDYDYDHDQFGGRRGPYYHEYHKDCRRKRQAELARDNFRGGDYDDPAVATEEDDGDADDEDDADGLLRRKRDVGRVKRQSGETVPYVLPNRSRREWSSYPASLILTSALTEAPSDIEEKEESLATEDKK